MRNYSSIASEKTLADALTSSATTIQVSDVNGFPATPFTLVLEPDTVREEIVTVTDISGTQLTISRGEEGTLATAHDVGTKARHMITGRDLQDAQNHMNATENVHGIGDTAFLVNLNGAQTLTNKTLTEPRLNEATPLSATSSELNVLDGVSITTAELNRLSGVTSNVQSQINTIVNVTIPNATPVGTLTMFAGADAPTGWLLCNGAAVSRTTYATLFGIIGITYGSGNGTDTFNLPDLRGRAPIGVGTGRNNDNTADLTTRNRGTKVGTETHTLTIDEMPSHGHQYGFGYNGNLSQSNVYVTQVSTSLSSYGSSTGTGGSQPHNNMQPSLAVNFIIKH